MLSQVPSLNLLAHHVSRPGFAAFFRSSHSLSISLSLSLSLSLYPALALARSLPPSLSLSLPNPAAPLHSKPNLESLDLHNGTLSLSLFALLSHPISLSSHICSFLPHLFLTHLIHHRASLCNLHSVSTAADLQPKILGPWSGPRSWVICSQTPLACQVPGPHDEGEALGTGCRPGRRLDLQ